MSKSDDQMLDELFALGRSQTPLPSDDLVARILNDAQTANLPEPRAKQSTWAGFFDFIGGWPSIGGLTAAGLTGIWFGVAPPTTVSDFAADLIGTTVTVDLLDDTDNYFSETLIDG